MDMSLLFECTRLKAKLTLAGCEANRAKPEDSTTWMERKPIMPHACKGCEDWKTWDIAPIPLEEKVSMDIAEQPNNAACHQANDAVCQQPNDAVYHQANDAAYHQLEDSEYHQIHDSEYHRIFENAPSLPELFAALTHARNKHPDFPTSPMGALPILVEEVGEVARAIYEGDPAAQREELLHVGAVVLRMLDEMPTAADR